VPGAATFGLMLGLLIVLVRGRIFSAGSSGKGKDDPSH
jgi:hypothetical protein